MEPDENVTIVWKHRIEASDHYRRGNGIRSRLAWWLRRHADKLDGGRSVRFYHKTTPELPEAEVSACIVRGIDHANRLLGNLAHQAACEQAMAKTNAELFDG